MGGAWTAVFAGVIVAATGNGAGLEAFQSTIESGKKEEDNNLKLHL